MSKETLSTQPSWVTNVYAPEGDERFGVNRPTTIRPEEERNEDQTSVAEIVSQVNLRK